MMSADIDINVALKQLGFDETDTIMYLTLLKIGSVTVGNLSTKLGMDRGKAYRSLNKLRSLGVIETTFSNPTTCIAIKPEQALMTIIEKKENEIISMRKIADGIIKNQDQLMHKEQVQESSTFSIIQGRINVYTRIAKLIEDASEIVYIITTLDDLMIMYHTAIPEKIKNAIKNNKQIRLITEIDNPELIPLVTRLGVTETRIGKLPSKGRTIVEKGKHTIMSGAMKESKTLNDENDSILYTTSPDMVDNIHSLCAHIWSKSRSIEVISKQVKTS